MFQSKYGLPRFLMGCVLLLLTGCAQKMAAQPRYDPLVPGDFFPDGQSARPPIPDTVSRDALAVGTPLDTGKLNGKYVTTFPIPITREVLTRGQERFNIFCSPCHDRVGTGNGIAVQRGFTGPPTYHTTTLRDLPNGQYFDVITNGGQDMPPYGPQIPVMDRWAIIAYVRALQLSQHAPLSDLTPSEQQMLQGMK